jgi:hypothetical protein
METPEAAWLEVTGKDSAEIEQFGLTFDFFADPVGHAIGLSKGVS